MIRKKELLVDSLYASVADETPWLGFLTALEQHLPCHHATMLLRRPRDGDAGVVIAGANNDPALSALQREHYRNSPFLDLPEGKVCVLTKKELSRRHRTYQRYMRYFSPTTDLIGLDLVDPKTEMTFRLRAARIDGEPGFGNKEKKLLTALIPNLRTATAISARLSFQDYQMNVLDDAVSQIAIGTMILEDTGQILIKNRVLDEILQKRDGLHAQENTLHCNDPRDDRTLQSLLRQFRRDTTSPPAIRTMKVRRDSGQFWNILLKHSAVQPGLGDSVMSTVRILLRDTNPHINITENTLIENLKFTRAEAALAVKLVQGQSVADAATALGISRCTARVQLASMFGRIGVHRQAQLITYIMATLGSDWN
ncbi:MAG: hypothetical protein H7A11_08245 [Pseudomonadales bacterium]|nr:hypothetical protein [Pseudomonadales bacterium]